VKECKKRRKENYRRVSNELKTATDKTKKEYLERICDKTTELQRT
jgi:hypothetical protein